MNERGRMFLPAPRPKAYRHQRRPKQCFANAQVTVFERSEGDYVEGVAVSESGYAVAHARVTLDGVHAVDPSRVSAISAS
jgi:hypothetical protein